MIAVDRYGEFFWLMKSVYQMLSIAFNEGFVSEEITLAQYLVLATLQSEPRLTSAEVARRCSVSAQAANVTIARLEALNLIRRRPAAAGGRSLEATLTKRGETILADCRTMTRRIGGTIFAGIEVTAIDTTNAVLGELARALERPGKVRPLRAWDQTAPEPPDDGAGQRVKPVRPRRRRA